LSRPPLSHGFPIIYSCTVVSLYLSRDLSTGVKKKLNHTFFQHISRRAARGPVRLARALRERGSTADRESSRHRFVVPAPALPVHPQPEPFRARQRGPRPEDVPCAHPDRESHPELGESNEVPRLFAVPSVVVTVTVVLVLCSKRARLSDFVR